MSESEYIKVFTGNIIDTEHLKVNFEAAGIEPILKDTNLGVTATLATDYLELREMYVHKSELEKATSILETTFPKAN